MPRACKSGKLFAISETSFLQVFPLDSRREGLRERGWVIICRHFEKKATTYYVGRHYLLSFMFPRNSLKEWGVPSLHHLKARPAFLLRLDYLPFAFCFFVFLLVADLSSTLSDDFCIAVSPSLTLAHVSSFP